MKKVSVVVLCYNAADDLNACVNRLLRQTLGMDYMELILIDNASTDGGLTWKRIQEYEQEYPDVIVAVALDQYLSQGSARNVGISCAGGEYLIFCDVNDWLAEEALEHCYNKAKEYDADVVEFLTAYVRGHETPVRLEKGNESFLIELETEEKRKEYLLYADQKLTYDLQTKFYRLSMIQAYQIAFLDHLSFEELSFTVPVRLYEKRHYFLDEQLYVCCLSPRSRGYNDWSNDHKWDNLQVWVLIIKELEGRGLLWEYEQEVEYLFFSFGLRSSVKMIFRGGYILTKEELKLLASVALRLFPNISQNKYINRDNANQILNRLILLLLEIEITDESIQLVNRLLGGFTRRI